MSATRTKQRRPIPLASEWRLGIDMLAVTREGRIKPGEFYR
jgi:hypothetical protein